MPRTSIDQEILRLLADAPRTSAQLAEICGRHPRHIRRITGLLLQSGQIAGSVDPSDRRSIIYYITTTNSACPLSPPAPAKIGDILEDISGDRGHFRGHLGDIIEDITPNCAPIGKTTPTMHSDPEILPHQHPPHWESADPAENRGHFRGHPGTCTVNDDPNPHTCHSCPLQVCDLEHDAVQFGIIDAWTATMLPRIAQQKGWEKRQNPHTKVWTLYPPALHPLTLQTSSDTVTVYSSEPGDVEWIVGWFAAQLGAMHPHPDRLAHKIRHPELYRDEQTIVITDPATIESIRSVSAPYADPRNRVLYIESPNTAIPGFKLYERDGTMRIEFDARDETRARAALVMRQELLQLLPNVSLHPGLFLQWRGRYYNPVTQPVLINLEQADVVAAIDRMAVTLSHRMDAIEKRIDGPDDDLAELIEQIADLDDYDLESVTDLLSDYAKNEDAALVFLGAWQLWSQSRYRRSVISEDVSRLLIDQKIHIPAVRIAKAIEALTACGLTERNAEHIHFTGAGIAVGKKILAKKQAPED